MKQFYKGFKGAKYGPASPVRYYSDEESLKLQLRLKKEGRIDEVKLRPLEIHVTRERKSLITIIEAISITI